jgi:ribosomal protein S18 acetylase RimI-like enzyme
MTMADYPRVRRIWAGTPGICLVADDARAGIAVYLRRNRGLCFVAAAGTGIVGTVLCGHDGRRAILRHLAVVPGHQGRGLGRALTQRCLRALTACGIPRCSVYVLDDNAAGMDFWRHLGFAELAYDYRTLQAPTRPGRRRPAAGRKAHGRPH